MRFIIIATLAAMLTGCAAFGGPPIQGQLTYCDGAKPIRPAKGETANLSDKLVGQINQHNSLGAKACGWKP